MSKLLARAPGFWRAGGPRAGFWLEPLQTRWADNDVYGHINNVQYYAFFDTAINTYLIREGGLDIHRSAAIGLCVESKCEFKRPLAFPQPLEVGLRVGKLGTSSVRYDLAIFDADEAAEPAASGHFVHVFVDRARPDRTTPIPDSLRQALQALCDEGSKL